MGVDDVGDDRVPLLLLGPVHQIRILDAEHLAVRRGDDDIELVDLGELFGFGVGGAGHAGQLLVLAEVVLEGDRGERLVLALDLHAFLGFNSLMQPVAPATSRHQAAGEFVDDDDLAVLHHVVDVELVDGVRAQRLVDVVLDVGVLEVVDVAVAEPVEQQLLRLLHAALGERDGLVFLVDHVVAGEVDLLALLGLHVATDDSARFELGDDLVDLVVEVGRGLRRTRDDERGAGFVDEDAVDFVDDREVMTALHVVREVELHVVAEVVESEFVVGAVGDVGGVRRLALGIVQVVLDDTDAHAEEAVDLAHPLGVAAGEVVVHGDNVDALAFEGVQVGRQGGDERLAFTGFHLGDASLVEHGTADELHVEVAHLQDAPAGFADHRERLG